jgi:hypothetical protein
MAQPLSRDLQGARDAYLSGNLEASRSAHDRLLGPRSRPGKKQNHNVLQYWNRDF